MAKTTKAQRKAVVAIDDAAAAAKQARKVAKTLPGKNAEKLRDVAAVTIGEVDVSKKALRKNPGKIAKRAQRAAERVRKAMRAAIAKSARKERLRAQNERAAAESARTADDVKALSSEESMTDAATAASAEPAAAETLTPEPERAPEPTASTPPQDALAALTVAQLRERARATGATGHSRLTKAQLIALLS